MNWSKMVLELQQPTVDYQVKMKVFLQPQRVITVIPKLFLPAPPPFVVLEHAPHPPIPHLQPDTQIISFQTTMQFISHVNLFWTTKLIKINCMLQKNKLNLFYKAIQSPPVIILSNCCFYCVRGKQNYGFVEEGNYISNSHFFALMWKPHQKSVYCAPHSGNQWPSASKRLSTSGKTMIVHHRFSTEPHFKQSELCI